MSVNIGIIGFGWMANWHVRKIIPRNEGIGVRAVFDIDPARVQDAVERGMRGYSTLSDFLKDGTFDTVLVATPNHTHKDLVLAALNAGKNVICEKPATLNAEELCEILEVAKQQNKIFTAHQNRRRDKDYCIVKKAIEEGMVGEPFYIESRVQGANGIPSDWRRHKESGGGMLYDWGAHLVDQILQLVPGPVVEVYAHLLCINYSVDDNFKALLKFENGVSAQIEVDTACFQSLPRWHVLGTKGTLNIDNWECVGSVVQGNVEEIDWGVEGLENAAGSTRTMRPRSKETTRTLTLPEVHADWSDFYRNYKAALEGKAELAVKPEEVLRAVRVMDAIRESGEKGVCIKGKI